MTPRDSGDGRKVKNTAPGLAGCIRLHSYYNTEICRMKRTANTIGTRRTRTAKASQPFTNMLANTEHGLIFKGPGRKRPGFIFEKYLFSVLTFI